MEDQIDDIQQGLSVSDTWQPLYVSMVMTSLQVAIFLLCFELARRHPSTWTVYDRRRSLYPSRTPPPLPFRWYYPTWWFVKCAMNDSEKAKYQEEHEQFLQRLEEQEKKKKQRRRKKQRQESDQQDDDQNIVLKAERICLESVPFFRDVDVEEGVEDGGGGTANTTATSITTMTTTLGHDNTEVAVAGIGDDSSQPKREERQLSEGSIADGSSLAVLEQLVRNDSDDDDVEVWDAYEEEEDDDVGDDVNVDEKIPVKETVKVERFSPSPPPAAAVFSLPSLLLSRNDKEEQEFGPVRDHSPTRPTISGSNDNSAIANDGAGDTSGHPKDDDDNKNTNTANVAAPSAIPMRPASSILRRSTSLPNTRIKYPSESSFFSSTTISRKKRSNDNKRGTFTERNIGSEHNPPMYASVPFEIGGESSSDHTATATATTTTTRRVRFGSMDSRTDNDNSRFVVGRSITTDVTVGSRESVRLAKLRYGQEDVTAQWDRRIVQAGSGFLRRRVLMLRDDNEDDEEEQQEEEEEEANNDEQINSFSDTGVKEEHKKFISRQVMRRPLSAEDQELLRCIGLDAFMTLRFLRLGLDVFFWPLLVAIVTLLPLYLTADRGVIGYFRTTIIALVDNAGGKFWLVVLYEYVHISYILRRLWTEWELFLPLRHDYLEHGDFEKEKYREQYRLTCLVEFIPASHRNDKALFQFFDSLFPAQVKRAEVLLNTEYLRKMIRSRLEHIVEYENVTAKLIHQWAEYFRDMQTYEQSGTIKRCCRGVVAQPREPREPRKIVIHRIDRQDMHNVFIQPQTPKVRDPRTHLAREWHYWNIQCLNKSIDDEYIRLAREQHRHEPRKRENRLSKWLGIKYITGSDTSSLHSSTAFVELLSLETKQSAIQCNLTGVNDLMKVSAVPEIRDIIWENAHVSRALIETRKVWADVLILSGLVAWSFVVYYIRSYKGFINWLGLESATIVAFVEVYLPALVVEGLVRGIPFVLRIICQWIRFKSASEKDTYVLLWYFGYRLITFVFLIVGGSLVDTGAFFIEDPVGYLERLATNVALESQFFISYVLVTGGMSITYYLSQLHNVAEHWMIRKVVTEEAVSQRKLDDLNNRVKIFYKPELVPLFLFIFIIGALYAAIAPIASVFVSMFFRCAYKVFKYMTLYIYGKYYENGGQLFYHLSSILFFILYLVVLIIIGYLSLHGSALLAGMFSIILFIILATQLQIHKTFVAPSRTLSLAKARVLDDARGVGQRKADRARKELEKAQVHGDMRANGTSLLRNLLEDGARNFDEDETTFTGSGETSVDTSELERADRRMQDRYREECDSVSDVTDDTRTTDFFIYRQPSMNRTTWELAPRPYRKRFDRDVNCEVWR